MVDIFYSGVGILNELSSEEMEEAFQKSLAEQAQGTFLMECALRPGRFLDNRSSPYYNLGDFEKGGDCLRAVLKKQIMILPGMCDSTARLGVPDAFALCMDLATEHAEELGCGLNALMPQGKFWLTVKTKLRFFRRPRMTETVTASTWPEKPGAMRCVRDYLVCSGDEILVAGKTQWAIINNGSGRLESMDGIYPEGLELSTDQALPEPFARVDVSFPQEPFASYAVRSTDIDLGGHMNNAAYVRALAGLFPSREWNGMRIRDVDVLFRSPCYEGNTLLFYRQQTGEDLALRAALPDGREVLLALIRSGKE